MMKNFQYNRVLLAVIFVGFLAAMAVNIMRYTAEKQNMTVDLAIDYEALTELSEREGLPLEEVMRQAKEAGITSLAVYEATFKKLNVSGKANATPGGALLERYQSGSLTSPGWRSLVERGEIVGTEVYVTGSDAAVFREVKEDLRQRLGEERVRSFTVDGREALAVKAHYPSFEKMNLGLLTSEMKAANAAGFYVLARPSNYVKAEEKDIAAVFRRLDGINVSEMVFSGKEALGAPHQLSELAAALKERKITLGLIEAPTQLQFYKQEGLLEAARLLNYQAARMYSIPKEEQPKMKRDAAVERWVNTDEERNIRIDLLHIYENPKPGLTLLETNLQYIAAVRDKLLAHGFTLGRAGTFAPFLPSPFLRALIMLGVAAGGVLYLSLVIPALNRRPTWQLVLFAVLGLAAAVPVLLGHGGKLRLLAALASANVFPALAVIGQLDCIRARREIPDWPLPKFILMAALALFLTGALSLVGAAYLSGALSDVEYFLEVNIFRGIKLTFVLPILLVAIAFLERFDVFDGAAGAADGLLAQGRRLLAMPVTVKTLAILFLMLVAGVILVARSGHSMGMPVSSLELRFRAFLEQALYARPRSKELLIGHPAFMLAALAWRRNWPGMVLFLLVLAATIGQGSMVETFAHMRTPVMMSFARGIGGLLGGAFLGAAAMTLFALGEKMLKKAKSCQAGEA